MYRELLESNCVGIVKMVSGEMAKNRFYVGFAKPSAVPRDSIIYRWWFPEDSLVWKKIVEFGKTDNELFALLKQVSTLEINGKTYYALYFGKSNNGRHRYSQHTTGNVHISTLRHTIYGLCLGDKYEKAREDEISNILRDCYFEWVSFADEDYLVECVEGICIALGKYPLNIDGNPAISESWRNVLMNKRKIK